jgi:hypothetical protein
MPKDLLHLEHQADLAHIAYLKAIQNLRDLRKADTTTKRDFDSAHGMVVETESSYTFAKIEHLQAKVAAAREANKRSQLQQS